MTKVITIEIKDWTVTGDNIKDTVLSLSNWVYELTFERIYKTRTYAQNRLLWAIYTLVACELGTTKDWVHQFFWEAFLTDIIKLPKDKRRKLKIIKSTTKLDTKQFKEYLDKIIYFCNTELELKIPTPNNDEQMIWIAEQMEREAKTKGSYYLS